MTTLRKVKTMVLGDGSEGGVLSSVTNRFKDRSSNEEEDACGPSKGRGGVLSSFFFWQERNEPVHEQQETIAISSGGQKKDQKVFTLARLIGILCAIGSSFFLSIGYALAKSIGLDMDALEIYAWRQTFLLIFTIPLMNYCDQPYYFKPSETNKWGQLVARTLFGSLNIYCIFKAVEHIPLADATAVASTAPIFCTLIARVFLKEKFGIVEAICAVLIVVGIVLNARPTWLSDPDQIVSNQNTGDRLTGIGFALGSAISGAISTVLMRTLKNIHFTTIQVVYAYLSVITVWPLLFMMGKQSLPTCGFWQTFLIVCIGATAVPMQSLYIFACQNEKAGVVSIARSSTPVWAFFWQVIFFKQTLDMWSIFGDIIILGCLIALGLKKIRKAAQEEAEQIMATTEGETQEYEQIGDRPAPPSLAGSNQNLGVGGGTYGSSAGNSNAGSTPQRDYFSINNNNYQMDDNSNQNYYHNPSGSSGYMPGNTDMSSSNPFYEGSSSTNYPGYH